MSLNIQNLDRLISHLEGLPEEKFNMENLFTRDGQNTNLRPVDMHDCGTAACIAGSIYWLTNQSGSLWSGEQAAVWLGLSLGKADALFEPYGFDIPGLSEYYTLSRAIRTLKHMRSEYLRTGQVVVDWDAPEPVKKPEWTAPRAVEQAKPTLPAEIVRFLRPADHEVVS